MTLTSWILAAVIFVNIICVYGLTEKIGEQEHVIRSLRVQINRITRDRRKLQEDELIREKLKDKLMISMREKKCIGMSMKELSEYIYRREWYAMDKFNIHSASELEDVLRGWVETDYDGSDIIEDVIPPRW